MTPGAPHITAAAARRRIIAAGDARAAQLQTPRQPDEPVVRLTKDKDAGGKTND